MPNGIIIHWGKSSSSENSYANVYFVDVPFTEIDKTILITPVFVADHYYYAYVREVFKNSFNVQTMYTDKGDNKTYEGANIPFSYIVIGK